MNVLVTGGSGFIGTYLCNTLKNNHTVTSLDNYIRGSTSNHVTGVEYISGDTNDITDIMEHRSKPDVIFHLGELSRVTPSFDNIEQYHRCNLRGTFSVLQYCVENNIKLVYGGSSSIFSARGQYLSPYAFFKGNNVELIKCYGEWYDLRYAITYFYNVYGFWEDLTEIDSVINVFVHQYKQGEPLTVVEPGTQQRCYTHISDVISGIIAAWEHPDSGEYHFGTEPLYNLFDVVRMFPKDEYVLLPERPGDRHDGAIPDSTTTAKLNWAPKVKLKDWICDTTK